MGIIIIIIISRLFFSCIEIRGANVFRRLLETFSRVPQGSFLGPLPCNIYWRYVELINQSRALIFADINFFVHVEPSDCCARLQAGVGSTQGWYAANRTNRNSRKTTFKRRTSFFYKITRTYFINYQGVLIGSKLYYHYHFDYIFYS